MADFAFRKWFSGLEAFDEEAARALKPFSHGEILYIPIVKKVNAKFRAKYQVLLKVIFENQEEFTDLRAFKKWTRLKIDQVDTTHFPDGSFIIETRSPTFQKVSDDLEFEREWFKPTIDLGVTLMHGTTEDELRARVSQIVGFDS